MAVVTSVVGKVKDLLFVKAKEEISYMWNCSKNVEDLEIENKNLTEMRGRVQQKITAAQVEGERLLEGVEDWVKKAEEHISEAKKVIDGFEANADKTCLNLGMCIDLGTLYHYGKMAAKKDPSPYASLKGHQEVGVRFESCVSVPARTLRQLDVYNRHNIDGIDTHKLCLKKIIDSIKDANIQIIGIYGTGGVGKTTLAKEVAVTVKSLFADVTFITVSQPVDAERIKKEVKPAANRIQNGEKILVILDDLWGELKLDEVGIPSGPDNKNCKILLTSRSEDVCKTMKATGLINVDSLPTKEAWILFKRVVGDMLETDEIAEKVVESIEDDNIQIIGIYGTGGVGMTTLTKEVAVKVKSLNLFAAVEFITVSQPVDAKRIKKEVEAAAKRIYNGEKILVILDDLWGELKPDEVGIPCGAEYKNCKILLTSRSEDVCKTMNATRLISVDSLPSEEAWILLKEIAKKVVEGCGGLPLIIQVVGAALKNESIESWKRALTQLQKRTTSYIDPKIRLAYSHLQLSYDFLESEEAKLCFLLCSMFPEDFNIPLERLAHYGVGLEIFKNLDSMEDARNRVLHAVKILKSTCLLLDGKNESTVKMHDVVREVALLIASKGSDNFLVKAGIGLREWQPRTKRVKSCTGISLMYNHISELPDYELEIPHLDIFLIHGNYLSTIPDKFILGVKEAKVLDFGWNDIVSLPPSLKQLTKLCMLNLGGNDSLCDISILGDLKSLEILILSETGIVEIPQEIGYLVNLRRLDVKGCDNLSHIAPGVMSKLRWLEELHIGYYPVEDGNNKGFMEIGELSMLTFVDLHVPHMHLIPTQGVCFTKLRGFVIQIGGHPQEYYYVVEVVHKKTLILRRNDLDTPSMLQVKELIEFSDGIIFDWVNNLKNIVPTIYCESLDELTTIMLSECFNLLSLVDSNDWDVDEELGGEITKKQFFSKLEHLFLLSLYKLHVLWNCPDQYISLKKLVTVHISYCNELESLFSVNAARGLVSLKTLTIQECSSLEGVICDGDEGNMDMVEFPRLVKIQLRKLKKLKSFYAGKVNIKFPSLEFVEIKRCKRMEEWGHNGTYVTPNLKRVNKEHGYLTYERWHLDFKADHDRLIQATITGLSEI